MNCISRRKLIGSFPHVYEYRYHYHNVHAALYIIMFLGGFAFIDEMRQKMEKCLLSTIAEIEHQLEEKRGIISRIKRYDNFIW